MRRIASTLLLAGAASLALSGGLQARSWHSDDTAALIGGLALGAIAASAVSQDYRHRNQYIPPNYGPSAAPFSPATGIVCYPRQYACYDNAGNFSAKWSNRVF